jgi:hypothetical protein
MRLEKRDAFDDEITKEGLNYYDYKYLGLSEPSVFDGNND